MDRAGVTAAGIDSIGITNQRETTLIWDRKTGIPIYPAIVWQDRRTAGICEELKDREERYRALTGLLIDPYFSGTKITWLLRNIEGASQRAEAGELAFGTVDSWLIWRLTGGRFHVTDITNASRTLIFDIETLTWSKELAGFLAIPDPILPTVISSQGVIAETESSILGGPIRIAGVAGDQQAAMFGQGCFHSGMAKSTYGTGCFLLRHIGDRPIISENNILTTPAATPMLEGANYAFEGSVFVAGAAIQWLRDELGILTHASESERMAASIPDTGGVHMVPAFAGLGAPYWDPQARGAIVGLSRGTGRAQIVRAALESIAFQCRDVLELMDENCGQPLTELRVDGGASVNNFLMQFQADILGIPVVRPKVTETTALGAAYLAGLATGFWSSAAELESLWQIDRRFEPAMGEPERDAHYSSWKAAVRQVLTSDSL